MTPKFRGVATMLDRLQLSLDTRAQKLYDRAQKIEARVDAPFAKAHQQLDQAEKALDQVESFVAANLGANGGDPTGDDSQESSGQKTV